MGLVLTVGPELGRAASSLASSELAAVRLRTPQEALNYARAQVVEVFVFDGPVDRHALTGLADDLRATPGNASAAILVITAADAPRTGVDALRAGADAYLVDPEPEAIVAQVRALLRAGQRRNRAEHKSGTPSGTVSQQEDGVPLTIESTEPGASDSTAEITARKQIEDEMRLAKGRYSTLFNVVREGFAHYRAVYEHRTLIDLVVLEINPAGAALSGVPPHHQIGRTWRRIWPEVDPSLFAIYQQVDETGELARFDHDNKLTGRWYDVAISRVAPGEFVVTFNDITQRKAAEQALLEREERLRELLKVAERQSAELTAVIESMPDAVYIGTADGITHCNTNALKMLGAKSLQDLQERIGELGAKFAVRWPESGRLLREDELQFTRALKGEMVAQEVLATNAETGTDVFIRSACAPIVEDGAVVGAVAINTDITVQKRSAEALKESEELYSAIFNNAPFAIALTKLPEGTIVNANERFVTLFEHTREQIVGRRSVDLGISDPSSQLRVAAELQQRGSVRNFEAWRVTRSGNRRLISINIDPVTINGQAFCISAMEDVTDRRRAEEALREADRRKDEFIAILSHELRNPLAAIRYAVPVLQRARIADHAAGRAVDVIGRQVDHLARLLDDLLDVARITRGNIELKRQPVSLQDVLSEAADAAAGGIVAARHILEVSVPDRPIRVDADPARLSQVIANLLSNAAKYTPRGGTIRLLVDREDDHAVIRVRDNGIGIPEESLPLVFDMFRRLDFAPGSANQGGLGIGLAVSKQLVELHGGSIHAHSAGIGQGAEFIVRIPAIELPEDRVFPSNSVEPGGSARSLKVLIVEDNPDLVEMLTMVVEGLGHRVRKALDGRSAVSAAVAYRPDVVLLDLGLPLLSGLDVARELRSRPETAHTRLIALTGWGQDEDRARTREAGFDDHLTKPADPATLERLLAEMSAR